MKSEPDLCHKIQTGEWITLQKVIQKVITYFSKAFGSSDMGGSI